MVGLAVSLLLSLAKILAHLLSTSFARSNKGTVLPEGLASK